MKLITRNTDYAMRALCFIGANSPETTSVNELVNRLGVPRFFLRKLLQQLHKKKILSSYKGRGGGFKLSKALDKIYLLDILEAFQGKLKINECVLKKSPCPNIKACWLKKKIDRIQKFTLSTLTPINLSALIKYDKTYKKGKKQ